MADVLKLWLGRHGEAMDPDTARSDFERTLTSSGRRQVSELARWLLGRESAPELVLHSPLVRARQTAETIAEAIGGSVVLMEDSVLSPGFSTASLINRLHNAGVSKVVCIGHQPDIGRCLTDLTGTRAYVIPGTLAGIEFQGAPAIGSGALRWLADPFWFGG